VNGLRLRRILAIGWQTLTEARRNKVFYSIFLFALIVILNSFLFTEVTITTMDRVLKDTGIAAINIFALALTIFTGVGVINREVDRRSIYTIVSKPIARFEFIVGKYVGLLAIMLFTCGTMFLGLLIVLKGYRTEIHPAAFVSFLGIFLEVAVLGAFAVLCSSFTSSFVSAFLCVAVYISGHLSPELLFFAKKSEDAVVRAFGHAIYYGIPNLERFNYKYHITYDVSVAPEILIRTSLYALAWVAVFITTSVVIFSRRDFR
jgi:ABC-type transport system involved in multi-copper enzyme maturation permease subunit